MLSELEKIILEYPKNNWWMERLSKNPKISLKFIEDNPQFNWDYDSLSSNPNLTSKFIIKYKNKNWNKYKLCKNKYLSINYIINHINKKYWDLNIMSKNRTLTKEFVDNHPEIKWDSKLINNTLHLKILKYKYHKFFNNDQDEFEIFNLNNIEIHNRFQLPNSYELSLISTDYPYLLIGNGDDDGCCYDNHFYENGRHDPIGPYLYNFIHKQNNYSFNFIINFIDNHNTIYKNTDRMNKLYWYTLAKHYQLTLKHIKKFPEILKYDGNRLIHNDFNYYFERKCINKIIIWYKRLKLIKKIWLGIEVMVIEKMKPNGKYMNNFKYDNFKDYYANIIIKWYRKIKK
jgi:hypothetical protein